MKSDIDVKAMVDSVASELSMQGFALEHELGVKGGWSESPLDTRLLYEVAYKLQDQIAALLCAAAQIEGKRVN